MWCASHSGLLLSDDACGVLATLGSYSVMVHVVWCASHSGLLLSDDGCGVLATLGSYSVLVHMVR
jgi:hypothetical protein